MHVASSSITHSSQFNYQLIQVFWLIANQTNVIFILLGKKGRLERAAIASFILFRIQNDHDDDHEEVQMQTVLDFSPFCLGNYDLSNHYCNSNDLACNETG